MFKEVYYRTQEVVQPATVEEVETMIFEVSWSLQTLTNRTGTHQLNRCLESNRHCHSTPCLISESTTSARAKMKPGKGPTRF